MRACVIVATAFFVLCFACCESSELEEQLRVLSKQVTTLLDRRREDLRSIEENIRRNLLEAPELFEARDEIRMLRNEIEQMRGGNFHRPHHSQEDKNDHLTVKWLSNSVNELKTELSEVQSTLNSTVILQNHEQIDTELALLRSDVANLNKELEVANAKNEKYRAELAETREEVATLRDHGRATAILCGKTKNQLKAAQLEWNHNWKVLNEQKLSNSVDVGDEPMAGRPSRHQRILKKHIIELDKTSTNLRHENERLNTKLLKIEEEIAILQKRPPTTQGALYDRINGNEIQDYIKSERIREVDKNTDELLVREQLSNLTRENEKHGESLANITSQLSNFDKLHLSLLELLENVESIENKVDTNLPEFRKEVSKLEVQLAEANSVVSMLKEEQSNTKSSVKAISVSVSNLQDKTDIDRERIETIDQNVATLLKSSRVQTSKLHDHILKAESSTLQLNATKSTIHLVQELKSFEKEYKSIINKLPHDCSQVTGPSGIYLVSPGEGEPILAYCRDGWTTVQKRYDGSVDFNRNWNEYSNGFGSATGEHWIGNRNLHYLTKENCTKLQINMRDIYGKYWQANYDDFRVADYAMGFKLYVDGYKGNASDALDYQNRMEFSTVDNDRDISNTHCASNYEGGWWFSHCQQAHLNGRYNLGLTWFDSSRNEWIAVSHSEMRVKRREGC